MNFKIGVLRGGTSRGYDASLRTGAEILKQLPKNYYSFDILLTKDSLWHLNGYPRPMSKIFDSIDVVFNALHGNFEVQQIFDHYGISYTGSDALALAFAKKHMAKKFFKSCGIKVPKDLIFRADEFLGPNLDKFVGQIFKAMPPPWVVKSASFKASICKSQPELYEILKRNFEQDGTVLVEEYIFGKKAFCGILENFRFEKNYALPLVEIAKSDKGICPAGFDMVIKRELEKVSKRAHGALGLRHYSQSEFVVTKRGAYLIGVNALPELGVDSFYPKAAQMAGLEFPRLIDHIIKLSIGKNLR